MSMSEVAAAGAELLAAYEAGLDQAFAAAASLAGAMADEAEALSANLSHSELRGMQCRAEAAREIASSIWKLAKNNLATEPAL